MIPAYTRVLRQTCIAALCLTFFSAHAATHGWRNDNSGSFEVIDAPVTWSDTDAVIWRTKMPDWSNTSPVIVGDKLITCAEPATLLCLDKQSGKILWQADNHYQDLLPADQAAQAAAVMKEAAPLLKKSEEIQNKVRQVSRKLRRQRDNQALKDELDQLKKEESALKKELEAKPLVTQLRKPKTHEANGFCSYIPQCDGKHIFVAFGLGTLACYDMDGKRIWGLIGQKPSANFGGSTSPVLAADVVVVGFKDYIAYDKQSGAERWRVATPKQSYGTPIVIQIAGEDVIITPQGQAILANDGTVLKDNLFTPTPYNAPLEVDGVLYVVGGGQKECVALEIPKELDQDFGKLWQSTVSNDRYYSSPLLHNGLLYVLHRNGAFTVLDARTGNIEKTIMVEGVKGKSVYTSPTYADGKIYIGDEAGLVVVYEANKALKEIGRNKMEGSRCNPHFENGKAYIRTLNHVMCVGKP